MLPEIVGTILIGPLRPFPTDVLPCDPRTTTAKRDFACPQLRQDGKFFLVPPLFL